MSAQDRTTDAPPSWSATQEWLNDLDRDAPPSPESEDHRGYPDVEPYFDNEPTELDVVDIDEPAPFHNLDTGQDATVNLDEPLHTCYKPDDGDGRTQDNASPPDENLGDEAPEGADAQQDRTGGDPAAENSGEPPRFDKTVVAGFVAATVVATIAVTASLLGMRSSPQAAEETTIPTTQISVAPAPPSPAQATGQDAPIPYTASAPGCPPGSTAAQSVSGADPTRAWVCVRNGVDGQVLELDLGRPMVVTAISIIPGWVGADASGADQWLQHRVLTRVQWILFNGNDSPTVVPQKTDNVRGEAVAAMPNGGVLASKITMIVLETSRAPADTVPSTPASPGPSGGLLDDVLGAPLGPPPAPTDDPGSPELQPGLPTEQTPNDPADNTFAVSSIKVLGHPPQ